MTEVCPLLEMLKAADGLASHILKAKLRRLIMRIKAPGKKGCKK